MAERAQATNRTPVLSRNLATNRVAVRDMGTALRFDGVDDRVEIPTANYVQTDGTWSFWCKMNVLSENEGVFAHYTTSTNQRSWSFSLGDSVGGIKTLMSINGTTANLSKITSPILTLNEYSFITFVKSGSNVHVYKNGVFVETVTDAPATLHQSTAPIYVGFYPPTSNYGNGIIDEPRIWNRALTAQEVSDLYFNNIIPRNGLVAEYLFDEATGTTALDSSGNGNHGTIEGATYTTDVPLRARTVV
jgi:hypothetical protein